MNKISLVLAFLFVPFLLNSCLFFDTEQATEQEETACGELTLEEARQNLSFDSSFVAHYQQYTINQEILNQLKNSLHNRKITVVVIMATWCSDAKKQVPIFQKIIDSLTSPSIMVNYIAIDKEKKAKEIDITKYNIERVPTFVFYENNVEIGRIVETPRESMEKHILEIVNKE